MSEEVEVTLDEFGCLVIPEEVHSHLGISPGMTLVVEKGDKGSLRLKVQSKSPTLIDKRGIWVVRGGELTGNLAGGVTRCERDSRVTELLRRVAQ